MFANKLSTFLIAYIFLTTNTLAFFWSRSKSDFKNDQEKARFCAKSDKESIQRRFFEDAERMAFANGNYGLGNAGVCWWHSRFQRNALYLANYRPNDPRPSEKEAKKIIKAIKKGKKVVNIPGFSNLREFSNAYRDIIIRELEKWQLVDGFLKQKWIQGISGSTSSARDMEREMDKIYDRVKNQKEITYVSMQLPGIYANHALLVGDIIRTDNGYRMQTIDSNYPSRTITYEYTYGQENFQVQSPGSNATYGVGAGEPFVPYVQEESEEEKISNVITDVCDPENGIIDGCPPNERGGIGKAISSFFSSIATIFRRNRDEANPTRERSDIESTDCLSDRFDSDISNDDNYDTEDSNSNMDATAN